MIVKVQLPLHTNRADHPGALVYARNRVNMIEQMISSETRKAMGMDFKAFFEAEYIDGKWEIGKRVADQDW